MTTQELSQATILFADLSGFTALTESHGDQDAAEVAARFYELAQTALTSPHPPCRQSRASRPSRLVYISARASNASAITSGRQ